MLSVLLVLAGADRCVVWMPPGFMSTELVGIEFCIGLKWPVVEYNAKAQQRLKDLQRDFNLHAKVPPPMTLLIDVPHIR